MKTSESSAVDASLADASTFHIVNLGCKVNRVESDSMAAALIGKGMRAVSEEAADLVIVNTCTVTGEAEKKTRKAVRHALASNSVADVIVTGCAAAIDPTVFEAMDPRVMVLGKAVVEKALMPSDGCSTVRYGEGFRTRVGIKVQDGCDHACTYCIVHVARGKARSRQAGSIVREARSYFDAGVKEIVLTGIDIGAYDDGEIRLPELVRMLAEQAEQACSDGEVPGRVRISSIEPINVTPELIDALASLDGRVCRHLHLPLQSGSTKVLSEMDRPYTAEEFLELVQELQAKVPGISLSTDVIVGFPGETDFDFSQTCEVVKKASFMRLHVFPYSMRKGTPAAERADQIAPQVKRERAARLRKLGKELAIEDLNGRVGTEEYALVEGATCLTESYHELPARPEDAPGKLVRYLIK